ncbi:Spermine synthase [Fragariocoptes setiger]|uniref:Spermine synthase n=1 Tax=Fragariocoptes setiger TaxID=1670756 RepID=A0ABQ7SA39_9ACAR|nr:Spermine synthase [Fragariocoptes setiger]
MALKLALISFEIEKIGDCQHDPEYDVDDQSLSVERIKVQPLVRKCTEVLFECLQQVSDAFRFASKNVFVVDHALSLALISTSQDRAGCIDRAKHAGAGEGSSNINALTKFYHLANTLRYKISVDIEQLWNSNDSTKLECYKEGISNSDIKKLVIAIKREFEIDRVESIPIIKRGRLDKPHYLVSSDERVLEYDFDAVVMEGRSDFQDIKILHSPSLGNTLLLNNLQNLAEVDFPYTYGLMDEGNFDYKDKEILILGGGDGGLLHELLKEEPKSVTMIDIDEQVVQACCKHLKPFGSTMQKMNGPNYNIIIGDCLIHLRRYIEERRKFDVIFNDLTDIPVSKREDYLNAFLTPFSGDNPWKFVENILLLSLKCLKDDGSYMNHATGTGNLHAIQAYEELLSLSPIKVDYKKRSRYVPSFMEEWVFYTLTKSPSQN